MGAEAERFHRRSIRLKGFDYTRAGVYFITMVTQDRLRLFGEVLGGEMRFSAFGNVARQQWERLPRRFPHTGLGEFVVMPNHVHGIIVICWGTADRLNEYGRESSRGWGTADCSNDKRYEPSRRAPTNRSPVPSPPLSGHINRQSRTA